MSEVPKIEEPVVAAPVESTQDEAAVEAAPAVTEPVVEAPVAEATEEVAEPAVEAAAVPVEEGVLGYKGPGLIKSLMFQKKFFYFGTEPVEHKTLTSYLRGEKLQDVANKNAAWAAHTGKGLLFFSKKASEKATPAGVFNLSEVSDISDEGTVAFAFTLSGHKHTFEATTMAERDNWVSVLKAKAAEATELAPAVAESEEYKKAITELTPVVATSSHPKKSTEKEVKAEEKKEEKAEEKKDKAEEKKARKSRSASRNANKRASIFGSVFGKKEEKSEVAKEETPVVAAGEPVAEPVVAAEPAIEPAAVPEITETAPVAAAEEPVVEKPVHKRNSIFGTLKSQFSKTEKKSEEAPKEAEPVSESAPVIPAPEASEPMTSVEEPIVPAEVTETPAAEAKAAETPVVKSDKRKSSIPFFTKKEKVSSDDETTEKEKEKPFFAKLRATVKGKKTEKAAEKPVEPAAETAAVEETVAEPAVVSEPTPVIPAATAQVAASA